MSLAGVECITSGTESWALTTIPKTDGCKVGENTFSYSLRGLVDLKLHISVLRIPSLILRIVSLTADAAGSVAICLPFLAYLQHLQHTPHHESFVNPLVQMAI
jgi:hypothetical protein